MSDWFWVGLLGGIGYALSGLVIIASIFLSLGLYALIRIAMDYFKIKEWKP